MHHEYSILYKIVNGILLKILGEPSEEYLHFFGAQHGGL